jgi:glutamine phosphoribosylpyrophosphate amidotransferase
VQQAFAGLVHEQHRGEQAAGGDPLDNTHQRVERLLEVVAGDHSREELELRSEKLRVAGLVTATQRCCQTHFRSTLRGAAAGGHGCGPR